MILRISLVLLLINLFFVVEARSKKCQCTTPATTPNRSKSKCSENKPQGMPSEAASAMLSVRSVKELLAKVQQSLAFGSFLCPTFATIDTVMSTSFDYIIVGGGSSGLVVANRLSACTDAKVLVLEAGGCPPLESILSGYFTLLPLTMYDYNMTSTNDDYAAQNLRDNVVSLTAGRMLGGSSSLHHLIWVRGSVKEYNNWAKAAGNSSWNYAGLLPYFKKSEDVRAPKIITETPNYIGTDGPTIVQKEISTANDPIIKSFMELGYIAVSNSNTNFTNPIIDSPLLQIGEKLRQSSLVSYLTPVKDRSNLYVLAGARVSRINFNSKKKATGVTFTYSDTEYTVTAASEVILAAGALISPQLLMLSGVGPSDHLNEKGIPVVSDLPVGNNLQDHASASVFYSLDNDTSPTPSPNPFKFPVPVTTNYINLSSNISQIAEYQSINLVFPHNSTGLLQLCVSTFKYTETICQAIFNANKGKKLMWAVANILHPKSRGKVRLNTTSINDQPIVKLALLSEKDDLVSLAKFDAHMSLLLNTTYFKSVGAMFVDFGLCSNYTKYSDEFWQCYVLEMSASNWHYCGTAALGSVVDANLLVKGVSKLRVVDASVFPFVPGGNINAPVLAVAEKAADMIISGRSSCTTG